MIPFFDPKQWLEAVLNALSALGLAPDKEVTYEGVLRDQAKESFAEERAFKHSSRACTDLGPGEVNKNEFAHGMIFGKCTDEGMYEGAVIHPILGVIFAELLRAHSGHPIVLGAKTHDELKVCKTSSSPVSADKMAACKPEADVRIVRVNPSGTLGKVEAVGEVKTPSTALTRNAKSTSQPKPASSETPPSQPMLTDQTSSPRQARPVKQDVHRKRPTTDDCAAGEAQMAPAVNVIGKVAGTVLPAPGIPGNVVDLTAKEIATNWDWGLAGYNDAPERYRSINQSLTQMAATSTPYGFVVWGTHIIIMLMVRGKNGQEESAPQRRGVRRSGRPAGQPAASSPQVKVFALVMRCPAFEPTVFQVLDMAARLYKSLMAQRLAFCVQGFGKDDKIRLCAPPTDTSQSMSAADDDGGSGESRADKDDGSGNSGGAGQDPAAPASKGGRPTMTLKQGGQSFDTATNVSGTGTRTHAAGSSLLAPPFLKGLSSEQCAKPPVRPELCGDWQECAQCIPFQSMLDLHPHPCAHVRVIGPVPGRPDLLLEQDRPENAVTVKLATSNVHGRPVTEHEFQVLSDLRDIQGTWVPRAVCETDVSLVHFAAPAILTEYVGPKNAHQLDWSTVYNIRDRIASAFQALHQRGVCHGDVALRNVVVSYDGWPVIVDFGQAIRRCSKGQAAEEWQEVLNMLRYSSGEKPLLVTETSGGASQELPE